jgi:hypothetical protein
MEVEYEITPEDLYAFQWRGVYRSPIGRRMRLKVYVYLFLAFLLVSLLPAIGADGFTVSRVSFTFLAVTFPVVALLTWYFERRQTRRVILEILKKEKPDRGQLGRHKVSLNEAGLLEATAVGESRTSWAGVDRVEQDGEYIFIYTAPHAAHIIPKRAFAEAREAESFYQLALASKEAAS